VGALEVIVADVSGSLPSQTIVDAAHGILARAKAEGIPLLLTGGVAIYLRCPSARHPPFARAYGDLDFATIQRATKDVRSLLEQLGYVPNTRFNRINAGERLLFWENNEAWRIDIFVDVFRMCHSIDMRKRIQVGAETLPLADLFLSKLQIFELNDKDVRDMAALLLDHPLTETDEGINVRYLAELAAADWGLYHSTERNLAAIEENLPPIEEERQAIITARLGDLRARLARQPKSVRWKLRAQVGERIQWYELPEEAVRG
jgi:hypothetical protein